MTYEFDASEYEHEDDLISEPEQDDDMEEFWRDAGMPAAATLRFAYQSSDGTSTERTLDVREFAEGFSGPQLRGHCHLRNTTRTFNVDRMSRCVDLQTGETVDDVAEHLFELYKKTPEYSFDSIIENRIDTLRALIYLLDAGDLLQDRGAAILGKVCRTLARDQRITDAAVGEWLEQQDVPSLQAFRMIVGRINKGLGAQAKASIVNLASRIANLTGAPGAREQEALDYMVKRFAKSE